MASKKNKNNQENILFLLMGIIILGLVIAGFFLFQKQFYSLFKPTPTTISQSITTPQIDNQKNKTNEKKVSEEEYIPQEEVSYLQIYYGVKGKDKIECESKRVRKNTMLIGQARQIVNSLFETPTNERLYKILPENLTLRGLFYDSGLFTIDFSREFSKIYNYGPNEQILAVYSIVNSLTEIEPKAQVKFLINGTEPENKAGHVDLSIKMSRLESIIEK